MAYASLVSLAQTIHKLLQDDDQDSASLHEKQQIKCLHEKVTFLQAFLDDFPEKLANNLEARIRDAANQAEDTIEYFMSREIQSSLQFAQHQKDLRLKKHKRKKDLRLLYDFQMLNQHLQKVTEEIDSIVGEVMEIKNSSRSTEEVGQPSDFSVAAAASSLRQLAFTSKDAMVGFDDDLMAIKARLCGESSDLQIIPIFGMGGIGKTTLAKNAYDDQLTVEHFQIRVWVTVSQDYSAREILLGLLISIKGEIPKEGDESHMAKSVYQSLKGRKYFIVMDDMWCTKAWDGLRMIFPNDYNGSRIMLTTRLYDVAAYPDSCSPLHEMHFMDPDQSWNLLKQKVFTRESCPPELESIGKTIARSCRGLPLAIVLIAGLLRTVSKTQASWENIATNVSLAISTTNDEQLTKILSLSYIHLPHYLRPCFLYMGGFPEDYEVHASKLIKLWIAEGFLKPDESKSLEEGAEEYLEDLVKRSLVFITKRKSNGKIKSCNVHDLVRDLCIREAEEEKFRLNVMDMHALRFFPQNIKNQRRISIAQSDLTSLANIYGSTIHTIIYFNRGTECSFSCLGNFKLLKVLDVVEYGRISDVFLSIPVEVFELFHLRYLAFEYPLINIPAAIAKLQNLQTLIIHSRNKLWRYVPCMVFLPLEIWSLPQLRHIVSFFFHLSSNPEESTSALENLQTLSEAVDFICTEKILRMIPNLKKLGISFVVNMDVEDYHLDNLVYLHQLEKLKLKIHPDFRGKLSPVFPASLKKLALIGKWGFSWKHLGEIVGSLPNLEVLKLRNRACDGDTWETSEGEFLQLKFLLLENFHLRQWITESSHFPRLKCLVIRHCRHLLEISDGIGEIPTLELIEVGYCNISVMESAKRIQKEQQENCGNYALQVSAYNTTKVRY